MALNAEAYLNLLYDLLPQGKAWTRETDSVLYKTMAAYGEFLARFDLYVDRFITESNPRTAQILIDEWERLLGLPDPCLQDENIDLPLNERQILAHEKYISHRGQSRSYFYDLAQSLGYTIKIIEYKPFIAGFSRIGDGFFLQASTFGIKIESKDMAPFYFSNGVSECYERLTDFLGAPLLECVFEQQKPAYSDILFSYPEE